MRKLMLFTIGFTAACAGCVYLLPQSWLIPLAVLMLSGAVLWGRWEKGKRWALICVGLSVGIGWFLVFQRYYLMPAHALDGYTVSTTVTIKSFSWDSTYGTAVDGEMTQNGKQYSVRLYLDETVHLSPGDTVEGSFRMRYTAPGGARDPTFHAGQRILLLGYEEELVRIRRCADRELEYLGEYLARNIEDRLQALFPEEIFAFVKALLLGDATDLSYEAETALRISGIRHVIAVSGLHVALLYTLLSRITFRKPLLTAFLGIPVLFLFSAAVGFTASVTRACLMVGLMMLSDVLRREYDSPTALAFAVVTMLAFNPLTITSVGFQMSVGSVAGILLFQQRIQEYFVERFRLERRRDFRGRLLRWLFSSVSVTLSAISLTTPLSALYFGTVSIIGIVTNLVTLWVIQWIFIGTAVAVLLSFLFFPLAYILSWCISWLVRYVLLAATVLSKVPLGAVYTNSVYIVLWLIFVYILLGIFLVSRKRQPLTLFCCGVIGLCVSLLCSWMEPRMDDVRLTALDVGQGQCLILQCEGQTILIDCGGGYPDTTADLAAQTLLSQGITHLDGIILTHGDLDHAGALPNFLTRIDTSWVMLPSTSQWELFAQLEQATDGRVFSVGQDLDITLKAGTVHIFGPTFASESNENSLCVLFEGKNCAILVTGDRGELGERLLLHGTDLPDVDLLIAGHHGSKYSCTQQLLEAVQPDTVFISVGANNAYGHPAKETLQRLNAFGCAVYRTDLHGTLIFRR